MPCRARRESRGSKRVDAITQVGGDYPLKKSGQELRPNGPCSLWFHGWQRITSNGTRAPPVCVLTGRPTRASAPQGQNLDTGLVYRTPVPKRKPAPQHAVANDAKPLDQFRSSPRRGHYETFDIIEPQLYYAWPALARSRRTPKDATHSRRGSVPRNHAGRPLSVFTAEVRAHLVQVSRGHSPTLLYPCAFASRNSWSRWRCTGI